MICRKMQHRIVYKYKYAEYTGICQKHAHDQQKKQENMTEYAAKNAIASSTDPRTRRLLTSRFHLSI